MAHNEQLPDVSKLDPSEIIPAAAVPLEGRDLVDIPGTARYKERQKALAQQNLIDNIGDGALTTTVASMGRKLADEGLLGALTGRREQGTPYDRQEFLDQADKRLDRNQLADIVSEPTLESVNRAHQRYVDELDRDERIAQQTAGSGIATIIGGFIDVDTPLFMLTGSAFYAAKLAQKTIRASMKAGLTFKAAERVTSVVTGLNAGFQGGVLVAGGDAATRETATWEDFAMIMLTSTGLSGSLSGLANAGKQLHIDAAQKELLDRIAKDDPNLDNFDGGSMFNTDDAFPVEDLDMSRGNNLFTSGPDGGDGGVNAFANAEGGIDIGGVSPKGVGAEATGAGGRPLRTINDPQGPIGKEEADIINFADEKIHESGFNDRKQQDAGKVWTKLALSRIGGFSVADFNKLYTSKSAVLNYMSSFIFESSNGLARGKTTASIMQDIYHRQVMQEITGQWLDPLVHDWAKSNGHTFMGSGRGITAKGKKIWNRELMLERNERAMGRPTKPSDVIKEAADRYDHAAEVGLRIAVGEADEIAVDGMVAGMKRQSFNPYRHDGAAIEDLMKQGVKRADIEAAYAQGYRAAGMWAGKDADAVAKAVVTRALKRQQNLDASSMTLLTGDGREFMAETLKDAGMNELQVKTLMSKLIGSAEDRAKEGFAKSRNELDMAIQIRNDKGLDIRLVDVMEQDMDRTWQRYARQVSGSSALARHGITNKAKRTTFIKAAQAEQRALGEEVMDADLLEAMFSHFNAGPTHGFFDGVTNEGVGVVVATAKRIANLGLLEKLGITQLGETGAIIAQVGVVNWYNRGPMALWDQQLRQANRALLDEVGYITGPLGRDELFYAEWFDLDDVGAASRTGWINTVSALSSNAAFAQSYTSAFNHVRRYQQKIAVLGMVDKVMRVMREGDFEDMFVRFQADLGLDRADLNAMESMVSSGLIEFDPKKGFVTKLNLDKWDPELRRTFGAALVRNMHQTVQKSMAGEQDAWMHTGWGSLMTHLMTFPMQAFQKQFVRNGRHMDMQGLAAMGFGLTTAMVAVNIRDVIDGRERSQSDRAVAAFTYNNMTGWIPMITDPVATVFGQDDLRINQYGPYNSLVPPVFTQADSLRRAPGALINTLTGDSDWHDRQAIKAIPFAGTYFLERWVNAVTGD